MRARRCGGGDGPGVRLRSPIRVEDVAYAAVRELMAPWKCELCRVVCRGVTRCVDGAIRRWALYELIVDEILCPVLFLWDGQRAWWEDADRDYVGAFLAKEGISMSEVLECLRPGLLGMTAGA